jgi:hypothetical protein
VAYVRFVMPEHLLQCHPFVSKSFLRYGRLDEDEGDEKEDNESSDNSDCDFQSSMGVNDDDGCSAKTALTQSQLIKEVLG